MAEEHPIICLFGNSAQAHFPLILAIGREPNADKPVTNFIADYDFRKAPRCAFWNTAYGMAARLLGSNTSELKRRCVARNGSPLIFADALPQGILNRMADKNLLRAALTPAAIERHIDNLFSHDHIVKRVSLVVASGIDWDIFAGARQSIDRHCAGLHIPLVSVPFFYPTNLNKIMAQLSDTETQLIRQAFTGF